MSHDRSAFEILDLHPNNPSLGAGPGIISKRILDYSNNLRQSAFDTSESFTGYDGGGLFLGHLYILPTFRIMCCVAQNMSLLS